MDATIIHNPYAALAEADGTGHILGRAWDYIPDYYTGTIIASKRLIENDTENLMSLLTAYYHVPYEVRKVFISIWMWQKESSSAS